MKIFFVVSVIVICSISVGFSAGGNQVMSTDQAVKILQSTFPMVDPQFQMGLVDVAKSNAAKELHARQMEAIEVLGEAKIPATAPLLIPFLNYSGKNRSNVLIFLDRPQEVSEDINLIRKDWPAFSALLEIPKSSDVLVAYALDKSNPIQFRVAAFTVLRYLDQRQFEIVGRFLDSELKAFPKAEAYIQAIKSGKVPFHGAQSFDLPE